MLNWKLGDEKTHFKVRENTNGLVQCLARMSDAELGPRCSQKDSFTVTEYYEQFKCVKNCITKNNFEAMGRGALFMKQEFSFYCKIMYFHLTSFLVDHKLLENNFLWFWL